MSRICKEAMNDISEDLTFTTEVAEDYVDKRLPTLDFILWLVNGYLLHSYYEKPMRTPYVIMRRSAMSEHHRISILANELIRRLSNMHAKTAHTEIIPIIENFTGQMISSGYGRKQIREVIISGVLGWKRKIQRRIKEGKPSYRSAKSTIGIRTKKKLLERSTWYRKRKREEEDQEERSEPDDEDAPPRKRCKGKIHG